MAPEQTEIISVKDFRLSNHYINLSAVSESPLAEIITISGVPTRNEYLLQNNRKSFRLKIFDSATVVSSESCEATAELLLLVLGDFFLLSIVI